MASAYDGNLAVTPDYPDRYYTAAVAAVMAHHTVGTEMEVAGVIQSYSTYSQHAVIVFTKYKPAAVRMDIFKPPNRF
jgi:hypothetical protein